MMSLACGDQLVLVEPQLVLFDKDGTLIDIHHYWASMIRLRARRLRETLFPARADGEEAQTYVENTMGIDQASGRMRPEGPVGVKPRPFNVEVTRKALFDLGVEASADRIESLFAEVDAATGDDLLPLLRLLPGVQALLETLDRSDIAMGIVSTDITARAAKALDVLGLLRYFRFVLGGDAVARSKPAPDLVEAALGKGAYRRERTVVVGDHPVDIKMGCAAGVGANIGVLTGLSGEQAFAGLDCVVAPDLTFLSIVERG